jgi:hypothetical protein
VHQFGPLILPARGQSSLFGQEIDLGGEEIEFLIQGCQI